MEADARSPPTYRVFRDQHGIPQFEPKRGTQALKDALIYAFPTLETELQLMQAALRKFFDSERGTQFVCELPENNLQASLAKKREVPVSPIQAAQASLRNWKVAVAPRTPSRPSSRASSRGRSRASSRAPSRAENPAQNLEPLVEVRGGGVMTTWSLSNGQELEKRKRQPYDPVKRRKVAENRGNACDKHRASKTTCDPDECPQNKIHSKAADDSPKESGTLRGRISQVSLSRAISTTKTGISDTTGQNTGTGSDTVPRAGAHAETNPFLAEADVFWDAFEQDHLAVQAQNSLLSFGDMASNSDSGYWTDSDHVGPIPWASCSNYPAYPRSVLEGDLYPPEVETRDSIEACARQEAHTRVFTATDSSSSNSCMAEAHNLVLSPQQDPPTLSDETPHRTYTTLLLDNPAQTSLGPSAGQSEEALMCSDDPFMGWASKKAHHLFDDYGWVLSHVENL